MKTEETEARLMSRDVLKKSGPAHGEARIVDRASTDARTCSYEASTTVSLPAKHGQQGSISRPATSGTAPENVTFDSPGAPTGTDHLDTFLTNPTDDMTNEKPCNIQDVLVPPQDVLIKEQAALQRLLADMIDEHTGDTETLLLESIEQRHARTVARFLELRDENLDAEKTQEKLIVQLIADEFLPQAYERRTLIKQMAQTASDPDMLWQEYEKAEQEDLDEFIEETLQEIHQYLTHTEVVGRLSAHAQQRSFLTRLAHHLKRIGTRLLHPPQTRPA